MASTMPRTSVVIIRACVPTTTGTAAVTTVTCIGRLHGHGRLPDSKIIEAWSCDKIKLTLICIWFNISFSYHFGDTQSLQTRQCCLGYSLWAFSKKIRKYILLAQFMSFISCHHEWSKHKIIQYMMVFIVLVKLLVIWILCCCVMINMIRSFNNII